MALPQLLVAARAAFMAAGLLRRKFRVVCHDRSYWRFDMAPWIVKVRRDMVIPGLGV